MALTQISTQGIKDGTITGTDLATNVDFVDDQKLRLGTGNDLQIFHNGSNSFIKDTGTGNLVISGNQVSLESSNLAEFMVKAIENAQVELYHNGSKKFETTSSGVSITGSHNVSGGYSVMNSGSAVLQLFSSLSSFACIKDFTDDLRIRSGKTTIMNEAQNETLAKFTANGAVELYHNNVKMLETTSVGISTAGALTATGATFNADVQFTGDNYNVYWDKSENTLEFKDNSILAFGDSDDFTIKHVSSDSTTRLIETSGGSLFIQAGNFVVTNPAGNEFMINAAPDGAVNLYHDNSLKFETTSSGTRTTGAVHVNDGSATGNRISVGNGGDLKLFHTNPNSYIQDGSLALSISSARIDLSSPSGENMARFYQDGQVELYHNNSKKFETTSTGATVNGTLSVPTQISSGDITITSSQPKLFLQDNGNDPDWSVKNANGNFVILDETNSATRFSINQNSNIECHGDTVPIANNTHDLGTSSLRWRNIFTSDLNMSNEGSSNDVDGTWGSYTIQEGAEDLFLINKRNGKKYKFNLTEVS